MLDSNIRQHPLIDEHLCVKCVCTVPLYAYVDYGMALMENDNKYVRKGTEWQRIWHTSAGETMCELEHSNVANIHTLTRAPAF